MATGTSVSDHGTSTAVGEKLFYKIGEVSRLTGLPAYVLRFWESEFGFLRPQKTRGRQRKYTPKDIETLLQIKRMRYERSEEHTSELQSQSNLVCRLLLEKKKKKTKTQPRALTAKQ